MVDRVERSANDSISKAELQHAREIHAQLEAEDEVQFQQVLTPSLTDMVDLPEDDGAFVPQPSAEELIAKRYWKRMREHHAKRELEQKAAEDDEAELEDLRKKLQKK